MSYSVTDGLVDYVYVCLCYVAACVRVGVLCRPHPHRCTRRPTLSGKNIDDGDNVGVPVQ